MFNNILITGGLGAIGFDICKHFVTKGHNCILIDKLNKEFLFKMLKKNNLITYKDNIIYYKCNVGNISKIKNLIFNLKKQFSSIDVLINCAGIQHISSLEKFPDKIWEQIISINLSSCFYTSKYILPIMKKNNWGRIINIASVHGHVASINKSGYVASKHGLIGLTKSIALETAKIPITCNAICPGWVNTPLVSKQIIQKIKKNKYSKSKAEYNLLKEKQPSLSFISGEDIAAMAYFLCSDSAKDITGSSINIDGGWTSQ